MRLDLISMRSSIGKLNFSFNAKMGGWMGCVEKKNFPLLPFPHLPDAIQHLVWIAFLSLFSMDLLRHGHCTKKIRQLSGS